MELALVSKFEVSFELNGPNGAESEGYHSQSNKRDLRIELITRAVCMQGTAMY